jgi:uncharacterized protein (DUF934 family)
MAKLLKYRKNTNHYANDIANEIVEDDWTVVKLAEGESAESARLPYGDVLVPLAVWQARKWDLIQRQWNDGGQGSRLGVWLAPTDDPALLADDLADLDVIGVDFPTTGDGRGYSIASLLRARLGYAGELRAFGAVERDYLHFLRRVGFDAFDVNSPESAAASLDDFSIAYQPAAGASSVAPVALAA